MPDLSTLCNHGKTRLSQRKLKYLILKMHIICGLKRKFPLITFVPDLYIDTHLGVGGLVGGWFRGLLECLKTRKSADY